MKIRSLLRRIILLAVVIVAVALAAAWLSAGDSPPREGEATVRIEEGSSTAEIARSLLAENVIASEKEFMKKAEELGAAQSLKPGVYRLRRDASLESIIATLEQGRQAAEAYLTVPEGYSLEDIAASVAGKTPISAAAYRQAAQAGSRALPLKGADQATDLEGFLFPSTYDIDPDLSAEALVGRQLEAFQTHTSGIDWQRAQHLGLSPYQALIVASLIEREAKLPSERPLIAAVIYNRLAAGMRLDIDATVQYAIGVWKQELTQQDLEVDSPYNTRLYPGLPPGPICNPGLDSIQAALQPAQVDYLYYVATGDAAGHHFFTSDYEEFLQARG